MSSERPEFEIQLARNIGIRSRAARNALGLTQAQAAGRVHLATEVYGRLERGGMLPSVPTLVRLSQGLSVSPVQLLSGEPPEPPTPPMRRDLRRLLVVLELLSDTDLKQIRQLASTLALRNTPAAPPSDASTTDATSSEVAPSGRKPARRVRSDR